MGLAVTERMGIKAKENVKNRDNETQGNRRERQKKMKIKKLRQLIAKAGNEIYRRKEKRKATKREAEIIKELKSEIGTNLLTEDALKTNKETWLDRLRTEKVKLEKMQRRTKRIRNNYLYRENQATLFKEDKKYTGKMPEINKFVEFWGGIWECEGKTTIQPWMETIEEEIHSKIQSVKEFQITEENLKKVIK